MATPFVPSECKSLNLVSRHRGHMRRRVHRRRHGGRHLATRAHITSLGMLIPDKIVTKLTYAENIQLIITAGAPDEWQYRGNSVFDPDFTAAGGQPYLFDQLAALYASYEVHGSSIKVVCGPNDSAGVSAPYRISVTPTNASAAAAQDPAVMSELPYSKFRTFSGNGDNDVIKSYMSTRRMLGFSKKQTDSSDMVISVTADPATNRTWFWQIHANSVDQIADAEANLEIRLVYYVEFSRRIQLGQSVDRSTIKPGHKHWVGPPLRKKAKPVAPVIVTAEPEYDIVKIPRSLKSSSLK